MLAEKFIQSWIRAEAIPYSMADRVKPIHPQKSNCHLIREDKGLIKGRFDDRVDAAVVDVGLPCTILPY